MYSALYEELTKILIEALVAEEDAVEISMQNLTVLHDLVYKSKTPDMSRTVGPDGTVTYKFDTPVIVAYIRP